MKIASKKMGIFRRKKIVFKNGFTLVEVLVAIGIFSVLSFGCYRVVSGMVSSRERIESHSEKLREIARTIRIMDSDFEQIIDRKIIDEDGKEKNAFIAQAGMDNTGFASIEFTRIGMRNPLMLKRSEVVRVGYGFQKEIDDEMAESELYTDKKNKDDESGYLIRYVWPVLDRGDKVKPEKQVLSSGVLSLSFEYLNEDKTWSDYLEEIGTEKNTQSTFPYALKIKIDLQDKGIIERVYSFREIPKK